MTKIYPIRLSPSADGGYVVDIPDIGIGTQGESLAEAIAMARDAIGLWGICREDGKEAIPEAKALTLPHSEGETVTLVDVDFSEYRKANSTRAVRRNVSLPAWLDDAAERAGINCSAVLQAALKQELRL